MSNSSIKLLSVSGNNPLALKVAESLGISLTEVVVSHNSKKESSIVIQESVRDEDVFVLQTFKGSSVNTDLMDLLILINACRSASARRITAVLPCYPYSRQDKRDTSRAPITARLVADMLQTAGSDHIITMDLHASQIQGFFRIPVDNLYAEPSVVRYIKTNVVIENTIIVSPDAGGAKRATSLADRLNLPFALIHKERAQPNQISRMTLIGDVSGKTAVLVDDMADTCGTLAKAAGVLRDGGAKEIIAVVTHGILSGNAIETLNRSQLSKVVLTNSVSLENKWALCPKLELIDIATTIAEACRRTHNGESMSYLFTHLPTTTD